MVFIRPRKPKRQWLFNKAFYENECHFANHLYFRRIQDENGNTFYFLHSTITNHQTPVAEKYVYDTILYHIRLKHFSIEL